MTSQTIALEPEEILILSKFDIRKIMEAKLAKIMLDIFSLVEQLEKYAEEHKCMIDVPTRYDIKFMGLALEVGNDMYWEIDIYSIPVAEYIGDRCYMRITLPRTLVSTIKEPFKEVLRALYSRGSLAPAIIRKIFSSRELRLIEAILKLGESQ